jgi:hypothetical protein
MLRTGKSMLQIMVENARWMDQQIQALVDKLASASGAGLAELMNKIVTMRASACPRRRGDRIKEGASEAGAISRCKSGPGKA